MKAQIGKTEKLEGKGKKMNRKEAISKAGFIAISAATTMMLLNSNKAYATSSGPKTPDAPTGGEWIRRS